MGIDEGARVAIAHRGIFAGRDPIAILIGRMTVAMRRSARPRDDGRVEV